MRRFDSCLSHTDGVGGLVRWEKGVVVGGDGVDDRYVVGSNVILDTEFAVDSDCELTTSIRWVFLSTRGLWGW